MIRTKYGNDFAGISFHPAELYQISSPPTTMMMMTLMMMVTLMLIMMMMTLMMMVTVMMTTMMMVMMTLMMMVTEMAMTTFRCFVFGGENIDIEIINYPQNLNMPQRKHEALMKLLICIILLL